MKTPIADFVNKYADGDCLRLHMPGHKGTGPLGFEGLDITEIDGADSLYEANGIIRESEENASGLFGCRTFYSAEGSSQCIRAMLYLAAVYERERGNRPVILTPRNVHKTFLSAAALLDVDVRWIYPDEGDTYISCKVTAEKVEAHIKNADVKPTAVYLTSPDYLGGTTDISAVAKVCREHDVLLLVDNAHGAYLKFLEKSLHPADLGAHICCSSAHKTLPTLTGGAYLHISDNAPANFAEQAKNALAMFSSTSPSYLILRSLDITNAYLADSYREKLASFADRVAETKTRLSEAGYELCGDEPLKITVKAKKYGYTGIELSEILLSKNIVCEFADPDYLVLMVTPETGNEGLCRLENAMTSIPPSEGIRESTPAIHICEKALGIREAMLSPCETVRVEESAGRILASPSVGCPPAVPIVVCGEKIDRCAIEVFKYYGIKYCTVVKETPRLPITHPDRNRVKFL